MNFIEERTYFPAGMDPDDVNASVFNLKVQWRGGGKWAVLGGGSTYRQMSRTGRILWCPLRMNAMRYCRFTFEEACAMAEKHVDGYVINGGTWAQHQARRSSCP